MISALNATMRLDDASDRSAITVREIRPDGPLALGVLDFDDRDALIEAFKRGRYDAERAVGRHEVPVRASWHATVD